MNNVNVFNNLFEGTLVISLQTAFTFSWDLIATTARLPSGGTILFRSQYALCAFTPCINKHVSSPT